MSSYNQVMSISHFFERSLSHAAFPHRARSKRKELPQLRSRAKSPSFFFARLWKWSVYTMCYTNALTGLLCKNHRRAKDVILRD